MDIKPGAIMIARKPSTEGFMYIGMEVKIISTGHVCDKTGEPCVLAELYNGEQAGVLVSHLTKPWSGKYE